MRHFATAPAITAVTLLLAACGASQAPDTATASMPAPVVQAPVADEPVPATPVSRDAALGHYSIADATVAFVHATRLEDADGKLRLLLTPEVLSAEEQATVRAESWPGLSLLSRSSALYGDRFPFVVIEIRTGGAMAAADVQYFYVMASGIAEANHTDNINRSGANHGVELLEVDGDRIRLRASGQEEINGEPRAWSFDLTT